MKFKKYQHLERFGTQATTGIENGRVFVFPKIDGTNAQVYLDEDGNLKAGSRNRELKLDNDNAGFYNQIINDEKILAYLKAHPTHRLYGEFLVPHSLKTYRNDAWRKFYIFDVCVDVGEDDVEYLPYEVYQPLLEEFELEYIPPICIINNTSMNDLTPERITQLLDKSTYLIQEGEGKGEGVVLKNYGYRNKYGKVIWAKVVSNEFKGLAHKAMGAPEINTQESIEQKIVEKYCTESFIEKEFCKILNDNNGEWSSKMIGKLLGVVWHEFIVEESWNFIKEFKNPTIDYKRLNNLVIHKIKIVKSELF